MSLLQAQPQVHEGGETGVRAGHLCAAPTKPSAEFQAQKILRTSNSDVWSRITRSELATHCRRKMHGTEETTRLSQQLLDTFDGESGSRHPRCPSAEFGAHLGHLALADTPRGLYPGSRGLIAVHTDQQAQEGRHAAARVQVRPRIHLAGVIPPPPEPVHPRHQRQRHALSGLSAGGSRALE